MTNKTFFTYDEQIEKLEKEKQLVISGVMAVFTFIKCQRWEYIISCLFSTNKSFHPQ